MNFFLMFIKAVKLIYNITKNKIICDGKGSVFYIYKDIKIKE